MKIINKTKNSVLAENIIFRRSFFELMSGLIPYKIKNRYLYDIFKTHKFNKKDAMVFKVRYYEAIHTLFMSFSISIVLTDRNLRVIEKSRMKPFTFYIPKKSYSYLIEMIGSKFSKVDIGDELLFIH
ncbi:MAG: DUF192 domain-containing protein [Candidatus Aenigmarchaeota archaeon]|nr:DUF192 domain-containing protein [Candidatus Aenigmarchaeota archaeon]